MQVRCPFLQKSAVNPAGVLRRVVNFCAVDVNMTQRQVVGSNVFTEKSA